MINIIATINPTSNITLKFKYTKNAIDFNNKNIDNRITFILNIMIAFFRDKDIYVLFDETFGDIYLSDIKLKNHINDKFYYKYYIFSIFNRNFSYNYYIYYITEYLITCEFDRHYNNYLALMNHFAYINYELDYLYHEKNVSQYVSGYSLSFYFNDEYENSEIKINYNCANSWSINIHDHEIKRLTFDELLIYIPERFKVSLMNF